MTGRRDQLSGAVAHGGLLASPSDLARVAIEIRLAFPGRSTRLLSKRSAGWVLTKTIRRAHARRPMIAAPVPGPETPSAGRRIKHVR